MFSLFLLGDILLIHVNIENLILILLEVEILQKWNGSLSICNNDAWRHLAKSYKELVREWIFNYIVKFVRIYHPLFLRAGLWLCIWFSISRILNIVLFMVRFLQEFSSVSGWKNMRADNFPAFCCLPPAETLRNLNTWGMLALKTSWVSV